MNEIWYFAHPLFDQPSEPALPSRIPRCETGFIVSKYSLSEESVLAEAKQEHKKGNIEGAITLYQPLVSNNPGNKKAKKELSALQKKAGVTGSKKQRQTDLKRLTQLYDSGRYDAAKKEALRLMTLYPKQPLPFQVYGATCAEEGDYEETIKAYNRALLIEPNSAPLMNNLGTVLSDVGRLRDAKSCFEQAIAVNPEHSVLERNLGTVLLQMSRPDAAIPHFLRAMELEPQQLENYQRLGQAYADTGMAEQAQRWYERALVISPGSPVLQHHIDALTGITPASAPDQYISQYFDELASSFDRKLTGSLQYSAPDQLRKMLDELCDQAPRTFTRSIDLGCGTGLSGMAFANICGHLTGVDLSTRMLAQARNRNIYDNLLTGSLLSTLTAMQQRFDLFICADVLIYVGDPISLFEEIRDRATAGALFLLTTEHADSGNFELLPTERYSHSKACIEDAATRSGMTIERFETIALRLEKGESVVGGMYILRLP